MFVKSRLIIVTMLIVVVAVTGLTYTAVAKRNAKYIGSEECAVCHGDTHPAIIAGQAKTPHHSAMADALKKPAAIVAVFDANSPIKKSDIRYVLGTGKFYQNYLDKDMKLLPAKWDSVEKKWVKIEPVDGVTKCVGCHVTNFDPQSKTWTEMGVGCEACHGPGGAHSDSMEAKDIVNPAKLDAKKANMICGQCHSQGTDTSGKYAYSPDFIPGMDLDQHLKLNETLQGTQNTQYNQFIKSKHGMGGTMTCTTCHDTHGDKVKATRQLRKPVNELCLGCHSVQMGTTKAIENIKTHAPSAGPNDTCATCHMPGGAHTFAKLTQ